MWIDLSLLLLTCLLCPCLDAYDVPGHSCPEPFPCQTRDSVVTAEQLQLAGSIGSLLTETDLVHHALSVRLTLLHGCVHMPQQCQATL